MGLYAADTQVPAMQSRQEIEKTIIKYGAGGFMYGMRGSEAIIGFEANGRQIKMVLVMPGPETHKRDRRGQIRTPKQIETIMAQTERQRWRALLLIVKAKLEAVESGVATFEQEFLAYTVLPGGKTVAQELLPKLQAYYEKGEVPLLLGPAPTTPHK